MNPNPSASDSGAVAEGGGAVPVARRPVNAVNCGGERLEKQEAVPHSDNMVNFKGD